MSLAQEMQNHVDETLRDYGIAVTYKPGASPRSYRRERRVVLRPVKGRTSYYVALHEIGHIVGPNPRLRLEQEVAAWRWALEHACFEPTRGVWRFIARCLRAYVSRVERWESMKLPADDHDFWLLLLEADRGALT